MSFLKELLSCGRMLFRSVMDTQGDRYVEHPQGHSVASEGSAVLSTSLVKVGTGLPGAGGLFCSSKLGSCCWRWLPVLLQKCLCLKVNCWKFFLPLPQSWIGSRICLLVCFEDFSFLALYSWAFYNSLTKLGRWHKTIVKKTFLYYICNKILRIE